MSTKSITVDNYSQGIEILNKQCKDFEIVSVEAKRKFFIGPKYCEISYKDLSKEPSAANKGKEPLNTNVYGVNNSKTSNVNAPVVNYDNEIKAVTEELDTMKEMFELLMKDVGVVLEKADRNSNDVLTQVEDTLVKNGVLREIAQEIIKDTVKCLPRNQKNPSKNTMLLALKNVLSDAINTSEGYDLNKVRTIMLVGPTGVGKTTTLAKLASILYTKQKEVGLITLDTYKVGAVAQLEEYSNILDFPIESCSDVDELQSSLLKYMDKNCVLIDTTGLNQRNVEVDDHLKEMVDMVNPDQLSLVLSATTKTQDLFDCIDKFSILDVNSIIITKIDETNTLGEVINIAYRYPQKKIAYFTNGQSVPSDIEGAKSEKIIKSIIDIE